MKTKNPYIMGIACCQLMSLVVVARPTGTAFTYQGQLKHDGVPVNDTCDFQVYLWGSEAGNDLVVAPTNPLPIASVEVVNGLFVLDIDFGSSSFEGYERWLDIRVMCPTLENGVVALGPRQPITPTPYALHVRGINVDAGGNVGIGMQSPDRRLSVDDTFRLSDYDNSTAPAGVPVMTLQTGSGHTNGRFPFTEWRDAAGTRGMYLGWGSSGNYIEQTLENGNALAILGGNVGIGTPNPSAPLEVEAPAGSPSIVTRGGRDYAVPSGENLNFGHWDGAIHTERMRISASGNVGIGTTNPLFPLDVNGRIRSVTGGFQFPDGTTQATAQLVGPQGLKGDKGDKGDPGIQGSPGPISSINGQAGPAITLVAGTNVSITPLNNQITIAATGGGTGGIQKLKDSAGDAGTMGPDVVLLGTGEATVNRNGSTFTIAVPKVLCTYNSKTYSSGAVCRLGSPALCLSPYQTITCQANGSWTSPVSNANCNSPQAPEACGYP